MKLKQTLLALTAAFAAVAAFGASGAPYEDYKIQIQRVQDAKLHGGAQDRAGMLSTPERTQMLREMDRQLQEARSVDRMTPEEMRAWITHHMELMDRMQRPMPDGQSPMMGQPVPSRPAH